MVKQYQAYNSKINAYVKYHQFKDGKTKIVNVKESNPKKPFKGIKVK